MMGMVIIIVRRRWPCGESGGLGEAMVVDKAVTREWLGVRGGLRGVCGPVRGLPRQVPTYV